MAGIFRVITQGWRTELKGRLAALKYAYQVDSRSIPMTVRQRRYSKEELAQRGQALYEAGIQQQVEAGNKGKIVAIDIETGAFELDEETMPATRRLYARLPDAQPWVLRIGYRAVHRFGARSLKDSL
jgi:hypothetical protein